MGGDGIARGEGFKRVFFAVNSNEEISMKKTFLTCMAVVALLGFDIQSFSVARVLAGFLPVTPINQNHVSEVKDSNQVTINGDVCQKNPAAPVYPAPGGYLRARPQFPANNLFDNTAATVSYPPGPFPNAFLFQVLDSLDTTKDTFTCGGVDNTITNPIHGYITIDHANYCTLSNPND